MKYCRACKIRASEADTFCVRCGEPLATFGARPMATSESGDEPAGPALALRGEIRKLRKAHRRNVRRARLLGIVCLVVVLTLATTFYLVYDAAVLSYAVLRNVHIDQDPQFPERIEVSFDVVRPGKVAYDRRSGRSRTEKLDVLTRQGPGGFSWLWTSDPRTGIDFEVIYRNGLARETVSRHFTVATR
jgi:hypothetical protein